MTILHFLDCFKEVQIKNYSYDQVDLTSYSKWPATFWNAPKIYTSWNSETLCIKSDLPQCDKINVGPPSV